VVWVVVANQGGPGQMPDAMNHCPAASQLLHYNRTRGQSGEAGHLRGSPWESSSHR
jgi:hypothetical protein